MDAARRRLPGLDRRLNPLRLNPARLQPYWPLQCCGWGMIALFNLSMGITHGSLALYAVCAVGGIAGVLLSHAWRRLLKHRAPRPHLMLLAVGILLLACLHTFLVYLGFLLFRPFGMVEGYAWLPYSVLFWAGAHLAWTVCYFAALSMRRARRAEAEALRLELHAKDVELRALQAQVNPHFFFNSLNSVRALIYEEPDAASRMIDQLAGLMRYALQSGQAETVPLLAELEAVHCYLAIEKIRFEERLRVKVDVAAGLEQVMIPPMSLQTLVENAVKYGVELSPTGSDICIRAWRDGPATLIEIANQGAIRRFAGSTQVGLANTRKRLALSLGDAASLELTERDGWVRATLQLPEAA
jgi:hypothetical protein